MTDIWDEKPVAFDRYERYSVVGQCYDKEKMDDWLETVKERYDIYVQAYQNMVEGAAEIWEKLGDIKELADNAECVKASDILDVISVEWTSLFKENQDI